MKDCLYIDKSAVLVHFHKLCGDLFVGPLTKRAPDAFLDLTTKLSLSVAVDLRYIQGSAPKHKPLKR